MVIVNYSHCITSSPIDEVHVFVQYLLNDLLNFSTKPVGDKISKKVKIFHSTKVFEYGILKADGVSSLDRIQAIFSFSWLASRLIYRSLDPSNDRQNPKIFGGVSTGSQGSRTLSVTVYPSVWNSGQRDFFETSWHSNGKLFFLLPLPSV